MCVHSPLGSPKHASHTTIQQALRSASRSAWLQWLKAAPRWAAALFISQNTRVSSQGDGLGLRSNQTVSPFISGGSVQAALESVSPVISFLGTAAGGLVFASINPVNTPKKSQRALGEALFPPPLQKSCPSFTAHAAADSQGGRGGSGG